MAYESDIDKLFPELFKCNSSELELNFDDINSLWQTLNENAEFDKLAKDSVSSDDDHLQSMSKEQKWISQFLEKLYPLIQINIGFERIQTYRKFFTFIFNEALFNGDSIIHICVKSDDLKQMERLWAILHKFQLYDLLHLRNYNKETCAHLASAMNKSKLLEEFIKCGVDINAIDADGNTPLHIAILEKNVECVAAILSTESDRWRKEISIDLSILNDNGYTPLHLASMNNNVNIVKMLDAKAAQMKKPIFDDVDGKHGNNALHIAINSEAQDVAEYLIKNKCIDPSKENKSGHAALYLARVAKTNELVNLMVRHISVDHDHCMDDDDDASSKDSFDSQEANNAIETRKLSVIMKTVSESINLEEKDEKKFDDYCFTELSNIFNKNGKWKLIANDLGYQDYVESWQRMRNPTKVLLTFTESLKVSKNKLCHIFAKIGEERAVNCIQEWRSRA